MLFSLPTTHTHTTPSQEFHVAYIYMRMGNSPRPGVFILERSKDFGKTYKPWQYFADSKSDCNTFFGHLGYDEAVERDDSVICTSEYAHVVPLEGGEVGGWMDSWVGGEVGRGRGGWVGASEFLALSCFEIFVKF